MIGVTMKIQSIGDKDRVLFPEYADLMSASPGELAGMALLEQGMVSGEPSVGLLVNHNGLIIHVPLSAGIYLTMAAGIKGAMEKWGKPWQGA